MIALPAPCRRSLAARYGDELAEQPSPGRCASCCPPARRRRWPRGGWPTTRPGQATDARRCASRRSSPPSGAAAAATPIANLLRGFEGAGPHERLGSSTTRAATRPRARTRPRRCLTEFFGPLAAPCASASTAAGRHRRGDRHRLADRREKVLRLPARARRTAWSRPRARVLPHLGRDASGPASDLPGGASLRRHLAVAGRSRAVTRLRRRRPRASTSASTTTATGHADVAAPQLTRSSVYARAPTPRGAVPLGLLALAELHRRRPASRSTLRRGPHVAAPYPRRNLGVLEARSSSPARLRAPSASCSRSPDPVAHPSGDARLRPAVRRRGQREHARHVRRRRAGHARCARADRAVRGDRVAARRRAAARAAARRGIASGPRHGRGRRRRPTSRLRLRAAVREAARP